MSESTEISTEARPTALTDAKNLAFTAVAREAAALAKSDLVPQQYRDKPANVMVAMELAHRIGASVMSVMQNLHVIQGKPSFSSSFLIGCVNASGKWSPLRFRFEGEGDDYGCRAVASDLKTGEVCEGPRVTWAMVKAEGWLSKTGSKWKTLSELMFTYRAAAFWSRIYAPEMSLGMLTTDERDDIEPTVVAQVPSGPRTRPAVLDHVAQAGKPEGQPDEPPAAAPTQPEGHSEEELGGGSF